MDPQNHVERVIMNENNVFAYLISFGYNSSKLVKNATIANLYLTPAYLQNQRFMNPYINVLKIQLYFSLFSPYCIALITAC